MKFLCDQMLAGLGRWLRIAGYDTLIIENSLEDREILKRALNENRILLTRDRHFLTMNAPEKSMIFIEGNTLEECIQELNQKLHLDWLYAPFSRCILCNFILVEPNDQIVDEQVPNDVRSTTDKFWYCPLCKKVYWQGSHTARMLEQLQTWQRLLHE